MSTMEQLQQLGLQQTLSPQMQQSLQILQTPLMELRALVTAEMMLNPTLEEESPSPSEELTAKQDLSPLEEEWNTYYVQSIPEIHSQHPFLTASLVEATTLQRSLHQQLPGGQIPNKDLPVAAWIIGNISETGYLETSTEEIARFAQVDVQKVEEILTYIQALEPAGVGARNLQECLLLQLQRQQKENNLARQIIVNHLEELGRRKLDKIAKALQVPLAEIGEAVDQITCLDPKPGRAFSEISVLSVIPDVSVELEEDGGYRISLNQKDLPHLRINSSYKELLSQTENTLEVRNYIREKIRNGRFFIRSIQQRQETLLRIAQEIIHRQQEFLRNGPENLQPLTMAEIANAVQLHETTISRAVSGKYIATPQGIFAMKYFFTSGYRTVGGKMISNESVRKAISEIIHKEDPKNPWSDQEIKTLLNEKKLPIARRTVTKYREQLALLPSHLRKNF